METAEFVERFTTLPDPIDAYSRVTAVLRELIEASHGRLDDPTPCAEWDVRALIEHIVSVYEMYELAAQGEPKRERYRYDDFAVALRTWSDRLLTRISAAGFLDAPVTSPLGETPGSVAAQQVCNDLYVHAWDLARALDEPTDLLPDLAGPVLDSWRVAFEHFGKSAAEDAGLVKPARVADGEATPADRVAAELGRDV